MFRRKFFFVIVVFVLAAVVVVPTFAGSTPTSSTAKARQGETLKIGVLTDHTSALQFYGFEQTNGFMLGLEYATGGTMEIAGRPIEIVERDNGGDIDTANSQVRELIEEEGVEVLQGSVSSPVTQALQTAADEYEIVLMAGPAASPFVTGRDFNEFTFRACRNSFHDAFTFASYALTAYGTNYVQFAPDNAFGQGSVVAFDIALATLGGTKVREPIFVAAETTDFTTALEDVRASGADFVVITWAGATGVTLFQQINDLNLNDEVPLLRAFNSNDIEIPTNDSDEGLTGFVIYHYTLPDNEINDWLVERHEEEYGEEPDLFTECGFASAQALVAAIEATEGDTSPEALIAALEGLEWEGPKGTYHLRAEDHQALMPMYVVQLTDQDGDDGGPVYELLETVVFSSMDSVEEMEAMEGVRYLPYATIPCLAGADRTSDRLACIDVE